MKLKRQGEQGLRRPVPLTAMTDILRAWFDVAPASAVRQQIERLQEVFPGSHLKSPASTVQRRLKTGAGSRHTRSCSAAVASTQQAQVCPHCRGHDYNPAKTDAETHPRRQQA